VIMTAMLRASAAAFLAVIPLLVSKEELRFTGITKQEERSSCGLAAAATLLSRYWGRKTTESALAAELLAEGDSTEGRFITLFELKRLFESRGFVAEGFRMDPIQLSGILARCAPVIVHLSRPIPHFLLLLAHKDTWWLAADPAEGLRVLQQDDFESSYGGVVLLVMNPEIFRDLGFLEGQVEQILAVRNLLETWGW